MTRRSDRVIHGIVLWMVVQSLLDHGADLDAECLDWDDNLNSWDVGFTPLLAASKKRRTGVLSEQGTDVNFLVEFGWTALQMLRGMGLTTLPGITLPGHES